MAVCPFDWSGLHQCTNCHGQALGKSCFYLLSCISISKNMPWIAVTAIFLSHSLPSVLIMLWLLFPYFVDTLFFPIFCLAFNSYQVDLQKIKKSQLAEEVGSPMVKSWRVKPGGNAGIHQRYSYGAVLSPLWKFVLTVQFSQLLFFTCHGCSRCWMVRVELCPPIPSHTSASTVMQPLGVPITCAGTCSFTQVRSSLCRLLL